MTKGRPPSTNPRHTMVSLRLTEREARDLQLLVDHHRRSRSDSLRMLIMREADCIRRETGEIQGEI